MKSRTLVSGDHSTNIQADTINLVFPDLSKANINHVELLDCTLSYVNGLKSSSFLQEASLAIEHLYLFYKRGYKNNAPLYLLASLTEELALTKMDLGVIRGERLAAIPLFLEAGTLWKKLGNISKSLFSFHMLGVCSGIVGLNDRAIRIYRSCLSNIPKGKRHEKAQAHVSRDLGIALNRAEMYEDSITLLNASKDITKHWHSEFNFGLDVQKLAIAMSGLGQFDYSYRLLEQSEGILDTKDDLTYVKNLNAKHFFAIKVGDKESANKLKMEILELCELRGLAHQKKVVLIQDSIGKTC
ncbi:MULTISPECIES: hypothetical protein [Vibrio]|nr:hypothetical protein [Vibrio cholerae]MBJ6977163.1 hypothetical protein [Vibrio cholerae]